MGHSTSFQPTVEPTDCQGKIYRAGKKLFSLPNFRVVSGPNVNRLVMERIMKNKKLQILICKIVK